MALRFIRRSVHSTFSSLGLMPELTSALKKLFITEPTPIQQKAIPSILKTSHHHLLAAQTGTGKTLAYLLPLLQKLKVDEISAGHNLAEPSLPRSLVIVPNRELTKQVHSVLMGFQDDIKLKALAAYSGQTWEAECENLKQGVDLLVTTPDRLEKHINEKSLSLDKVGQIVIDEFDTLLDAGFARPLKLYIKQFKATPGTSLTFVTATLPAHLELILNQNFSTSLKGPKPYLARKVEQNTQQNLSHLTHDFLQLDESDKFPALLSLLRETEHEIKQGGSCIVFCNSIQSCKATELRLNEGGFPAVSLHGDVSPKHRTANIERFTKRSVRYLVCTDLGARGLDFSHTKVVVQFDFPKTVSDYIHRAGRTGRAGRPGAVHTFFRSKDRPTIDHMEHSFRLEKPLTISTSTFA